MVPKATLFPLPPAPPPPPPPPPPSSQLIRHGVAETRERARSRAGSAATYMFAAGGGWVVDATNAGGAARYINHSCAPNCVAELGADGRGLPVVRLRAARDVAPGEEVWYDYKSAPDGGGGEACACGAPGCRGVL